jgi:hypothetical protein
MRGEYEKLIDTLGIPLTWESAKQGSTAAIVAGMRIASDQSDAIVNAYGVGARIITLKASSFPTTQPEKFDKFKTGSEVYVADTVVPVHLNNELVGYRVYVRGK